MKDSISIIIPTYNEAENISLLVERLDKALKAHAIEYEIIIIDDHSSDNTVPIVEILKDKYPITLYLKKGKKGKAYSLLEGFEVARMPNVAMIDSDLQYPPEAIPHMINRLSAGADIVVANRNEKNLGMLRKIFSRTFMYLFGTLLHGLRCDVQSGLKVFRKEIIDRIHIDPTPWTFDLEFLVHARDAGYIIDSIDVVFQPRLYGKSKVQLLSASWEIGIRAITTKLNSRYEVFPFHPNTEKKDGVGFHHRGSKYVTYSKLNVKESAFFRMNHHQMASFITSSLLVTGGLLSNWHTTIILLLGIVTSIYFIDILFHFGLVTKSFAQTLEVEISDIDIKQISSIQMPTYTIFCPLYKEWSVVNQFISAISAIDYPKNKLQVLLLMEEDDIETVTKIMNMSLPKYFEVVVLPQSFPKTKPKACNYGLLMAKGDYCVIYDAEDIPEKDQLKKAVIAFQKGGESVRCVQAKLNFYNPHQNLLTKLFTAEYSQWFDLTLPGLQSLHAPIPLGGTSNHFRTGDLLKLNGWDAFNVAEDCDLGVRLAKNGYETVIINSTTYEEANSDPINWFWQRTRWIKGYIQTYIVHIRDSREYIRKNGVYKFLTFHLVVGGKILSILVNPMMWLITIIYFAFRPLIGNFIESFFPGPILYIGVLSLVFGNFMYLYAYMMGSAKRGYYELVKYGFAVPFYWLSMSMAAWVAVYKLIRQPFYWSKTKHGLHLKPDMVQTIDFDKNIRVKPEFIYTAS